MFIYGVEMAQETASSVINDILQEIFVQANEQQVQAVDYQTAQRYMNRFMAQLDADGVKLGYTVVSNPSDPITVPAGAINGIIYNVAMQLSNSYDIDVSPSLVANAQSSMETMRKLGVSIPKMNYPSTLPIGSGNEDNYDEFHFYPGCNEDTDDC